MKLSLFPFLFLFALSCSAQKPTADATRLLLKVNDWGDKIYQIAPGVWPTIEKEILTQISPAEFESIKKYSKNENIPAAFWLYNQQLVPLDTFANRLGSLKIYKVAEYTHVADGKNYGKYVIAEVPFQPVYWDKAAKWDTVYFVFRGSAVEVSARAR